MKVIVAGFPKTGTKTLSAALRILNYNVYDFLENITIFNEEWYKIIKYGWTTEIFQKMYQNIDAVTDFPAYFYWEEIHKAFPNSKIIIMIRDEEPWCRSMERELRTNESSFWIFFLHLFSPTARKTVKKIFAFRGPLTLGHNEVFTWKPFRRSNINRELLKLNYRSHNAYVIQNAPSEKLLILKCAEGWEPLCEFLGVPIPDKPFPHVNKSSEMLQETLKVNPVVLKMKREAILSFTIVTTTVSIMGYFLISRGPMNIIQWTIEAFRNTIANLPKLFSK
ncbi:uncharacterized protein LOC120347220 isoform X1 [Styela clava]